jgi:Lon-like ATP-dependent protease
VPFDVRTTHSMLRGQVISWRAALHRAPHYVTPRIVPFPARHHASTRLPSIRTPLFPTVVSRTFTSARISYKEKAPPPEDAPENAENDDGSEGKDTTKQVDSRRKCGVGTDKPS